MENMPAAGIESANVLLDAVIAVGAGAPGEGGDATAVELALGRLDAIEGAYDITFHDDVAALDLSNLLGGTLVVLGRLVTVAAEALHVSREEVVSDLRAWLEDADVDDGDVGGGGAMPSGDVR